MSNLRRRIRSLEAQLTEEDGLIPNTPKWLAHWTEWFNRRICGEDPPGRIPIDALRILMQADDREDSDCVEL
jgi:hypothetical protein